MPRGPESLYQKVLLTFKNSALGLTDDELTRLLPGNRSSIKTHRIRHFTNGDLIWDGTRRPSNNGRSVKVYKYKEFANKQIGPNTRGTGSLKALVSEAIARDGVRKREEGTDRATKIREAISGLISIIELIETQLPRARKGRKRKAR